VTIAKLFAYFNLKTAFCLVLWVTGSECACSCVLLIDRNISENALHLEKGYNPEAIAKLPPKGAVRLADYPSHAGDRYS
jgi:hypothetical protein